MVCSMCKTKSDELIHLSCGHMVHLECFQSLNGRLECPKCHCSVASAHFDRGSSEWYVGLEIKDRGIRCCFKITSEAKLVPYSGWYPKWRRLNGRLNSIEPVPLRKNILVV